MRVLLLLLTTVTAQAYNVCIDGIYYNFYLDIAAVTYGDAEYTGSIVIPASITYNYNTYNVTKIESNAFNECSKLTSVTIPETVTSIGASAFRLCSGLTTITIPESMMDIGDNAFSQCNNLTSITIPEGVKYIGRYAFQSCNSLNSIKVREGNPVYDSRDNCNAIILTATNTLISGCMNTVIPKSVTSIENSAFTNCSGLAQISIPEGVKNIGFNAFYGCSSLTYITIPESVTNIGAWAFSGCTNLSYIKVKEGNAIYDSRDNCNAIIVTATNSLITGCLNTIIPESVTSIGDYAFYNCNDLTSITIPESVTNIGGTAFSGCPKLTTINAMGTTPPTIVNNTFDNNTYSTAFLYIPQGCMEAYCTAEEWKNFEKIKERNYCLLSLKGLNGGIVALKATTMTSYAFQIKAEKGWSISSLSFNGEDVTDGIAEDGSFITPALTGDSELSVIFEQDGNDVKEVNGEAQLRVYANASVLTIQNSGTERQTAIYTIDGKMVKQIIAVQGTTHIPLQEGNVYLVKIGERIFKVAI